MIKGFEKETKPLTEYEQEILPIIVKSLERHVGSEGAITNGEMSEGLEKHGYREISSARIRKIINYIRINSLIDCLMATNSGYFITQSITEMQEYIDSLDGRIDAIKEVRDAMIEQLKRLKAKLAS